MNGTDLFSKLIYIGKETGTITSAKMYDQEFMQVEGKTSEGKAFTLTLSIKEEEENDA